MERAEPAEVGDMMSPVRSAALIIRRHFIFLIMPTFTSDYMGVTYSSPMTAPTVVIKFMRHLPYGGHCAK